jgi:hypothetical protein
VESEYGYVLSFAEVCWLSRGLMAKRMYDLKSETEVSGSEGVPFRHFSDDDWMCDLASCSETTQHMSNLYINLQVANHLFIEMF